MRKLIENVTARFASFVSGRDDVALVVRYTDDEAPPVAKVIEGVEEASSSDLYWVFTDPFTDQDGFLTNLVQQFTLRHDGLRLAMQKEGMTPPPPVPATASDRKLAPAERLRAMIVFSRSLIPVPGGGSVVWGFLPNAIKDPAGFAKLVADLVRHEFPFPWCHGVRMFVRDDPDNGAVHKLVGTMARVATYAPNLTAATMTKSLDDVAADESLPLEERMSTLLMLATLDYAYGRFPESLEKFKLCVKYFDKTGNNVMSAMSLNGMGELAAKTGQPDAAAECFQAALVRATAGDQPAVPIFLNVTLNLANLHLAQKRWAEAEVYYESAQTLATVARSGQVKVQVMENLGECQRMQGKTDAAVKTLALAAAIAEKLGFDDLRLGILKRLQQVFLDARRDAERREVERRITATPPAPERVPQPWEAKLDALAPEPAPASGARAQVKGGPRP